VEPLVAGPLVVELLAAELLVAEPLVVEPSVRPALLSFAGLYFLVVAARKNQC
jgi:hypothetical protein